MGCVCSKGFFPHEYAVDNHVRNKASRANKSTKRFAASLRKEEAVAEGDGGATARLITNSTAEVAGSTLILWDERENNVVSDKPAKQKLQRGSTSEIGVGGGQEQPTIYRIGSLPNGERGAQVVAGWPSWLSAVAGEAIYGWVPRKADSFERLDKVSWLFLHPYVLIIMVSPAKMILHFVASNLFNLINHAYQ